MSIVALDEHSHPEYRHEALFYDEVDESMDYMVEFIRDGVAHGEPTLVVLDPTKIADLRSELCSELRDVDSRVMFADMTEIGANPARIIPAWQEFVDRHPPGRRCRGISEPIWATRSPAELAECHRHEALLNLVFLDRDFWLLCPYDIAVLPPEVVEEARRNHPFVRTTTGSALCSTFPGVDVLAAPFDEPLPDPDAPVTEIAFDATSIAEVRALTAQHGTAAGLSPSRVEDLVLSTHELAANSVRHGGGRGILRIWTEPGSVLCEVHDRGTLGGPLLDRTRPEPNDEGGRGLWLANQLCDLVQLRSFLPGTVIRIHMGID